jgi:hypothetical protein
VRDGLKEAANCSELRRPLSPPDTVFGYATHVDIVDVFVWNRLGSELLAQRIDQSLDAFDFERFAEANYCARPIQPRMLPKVISERVCRTDKPLRRSV